MKTAFHSKTCAALGSMMLVLHQGYGRHERKVRGLWATNKPHLCMKEMPFRLCPDSLQRGMSVEVSQNEISTNCLVWHRREVKIYSAPGRWHFNSPIGTAVTENGDIYDSPQIFLGEKLILSDCFPRSCQYATRSPVFSFLWGLGRVEFYSLTVLLKSQLT